MKRRNKEVEKLLRQQWVLASFGIFAHNEQDIKKIMAEAARICAESLGVPFCKICRYRHETDDLLVEAGVGWDPKIVGQIISKADISSPQGRAFITGEPVIFKDLSKEENLVLPNFYEDLGILSTIDVLIKGNGEPYGVLEVDSPKLHTYDQHDVNFLTGFTNVLASALIVSQRTSLLFTTIERMKSLVEEKNQLLSDKKDLAAELQHRVRNNLQLVLAMLEKQIIEANDGLIKKEGIEAIARRVMTLAKVYDHLLGHDMSRSIEFGAYVTSLCGSLRDFQFGQTANTITLTCRAKDHATISLDAATALGIVVTEAVSNSYLHAFSESKGGKINILLRRSKDGSATLVVSDNGKGFKVVEGSKRHGVGLIRRLTEQAGGTVKLSSDRGTKWKLTFPTLTR